MTAHERYDSGPSLKIAISGSSGLIGSSLVSFLTAGGHEVVRLVRTRPAGAGEVYWNHRDKEIEAHKLEGLDAVIHLAGENVFSLRWSEAKKMRIYASRIRGTKLLSETLAGLERPPRVFLSASGVNYYGDRGAEVLTEASPPGERGFLTAVTRDWEAAAEKAARAGIRTVQTRMGIVLTPAGGALGLMLPAFRFGLGGRVGRPDQYLSWIAVDDAVRGIYHALRTDALQGPVNVAAPNPVTMETFTRTLGRVLGRPTLFKVPGSLARLVSGEAADEMLLTSLRVRPERLLQTGYDFLYPDLEPALRHLLGKAEAPPETVPVTTVEERKSRSREKT